MFKRVTSKKTATYNVFGGWYIDIIETDDMFEAWIYLKSYGIKSLMWGSSYMAQCTPPMRSQC